MTANRLVTVVLAAHVGAIHDAIESFPTGGRDGSLGGAVPELLGATGGETTGTETATAATTERAPDARANAITGANSERRWSAGDTPHRGLT
jgi:hypothetical protein